MKPLRSAIIIGSTRPGRNGEAVAKWVYEIAKKRTDAEFELVDIKDFNLPLLDEPVPPSMGQYSKPHTKAWASKIGSFDGYVFVSPEYNHGIAGALKNAIDFLFAEWNNKAAGFVSYGGAGGCAPSSSYVWYWPRCKSRRCATRSCFPYFLTSRTSASSNRIPGTRSPSTKYSIRLSLGAGR
jgi:NADPH-dependent FMN reductase